MNYFWISIAILSTLSQVFHTYWAIDKFSTLKRFKNTQSVMFCMIVELMIIGFVLDGKHLFALGGAFVAILINLYYYTHNLTKNHKLKTTWIAYVFAVLIPMCIYLSSSQIK